MTLTWFTELEKFVEQGRTAVRELLAAYTAEKTNANVVERLRELAREQAFVKHSHFVLMSNTQGHVQGMNDTEWGFSACPHPDCALVHAQPASETGQASAQTLNVGTTLTPQESITADSRQASAWQTISSAPMDETRILLWAPAWMKEASVGSWNTRVGAWDTDGGMMEDGPAPVGGYDLDGPTHWMPLPLAHSEDETTRTERINER